MIRSVRLFAALSAIIGLISVGTAPLFALTEPTRTHPMASQSTFAPASNGTIEWLGQWKADTAGERPETNAPSSVDVDGLRTLLASIPANKAKKFDPHMKRLLKISDAREALTSRDAATRRSAIETLGITITKSEAGGMISTTFIVRGTERLRMSRQQLNLTTTRRPTLPSLEQPDGGSGNVRSRDELEDLIAQSEAEAEATTDDNIAYYTGVADEADAIAAEIENTNWEGEECSALEPGPSTGGDNCFDRALNSFWTAITAGQAAKWAIDQARTAIANFRTLVTVGIVGMTAAAAEAAVLSGLGTLIASLNGWAIIVALGAGTILYLLWELRDCLPFPTSPLPSDVDRLLPLRP